MWELLALVLLVIAALANASVFGTDFFCAVVARSAMSRVDDGTLGRTMGFIHYYGDRRMPIPGVVAMVASILAAVSASLAGSFAAAALIASGVIAAAVWLAVYARVSAPLNKVMVAAVLEDRVPSDIRELQRRWDSVINLRVLLQGYPLAALCVSIALL